MRSACSIYIVCLLLFSCTNNQQENTAKQQVIPLSASDYSLVNNAYISALLGLKLAQEGTTRCTSMECKQLAENILSDNKRLLMQLETIAGKHAAAVPLDITEEQLKKWHRLVREKGISFDMTFAEIIDQEHGAADDIYTNMEKQSTDPELKKVAGSFLQFAVAHKKQATELQQFLLNRSSRDTLQITTVSDEQ
jgi:predicted outer membrane protein